MNQEVKISVVIPNYNRTNKLKDCISSVLEQNFHFFEIIIVDDCSPKYQEIEEMILSFNDDRIKLYKNEINKGASYSRNYGVQLSKGKYIAFLDSDDFFLDSYLLKKFLIAEDNHDENIVYFNKVKINNNRGVIVRPKNPPQDPFNIASYLFVESGSVYTPTVFMKRSLASEFRFDESIKRNEDLELFLRMQRKGVRFQFVDEELTQVNWVETRDVVNLGWNEETSLSILSNYRSMMTDEVYYNAIFNMVILPLSIFKSKLLSMKIFLKNPGEYLKHLNWIKLCKYLITLFIPYK